MSEFYSEELIACLEKVKATNWSDLKTEGINFTEDFVWLEDYPFESEKKVLIKKGQLEALILVDLTIENALMSVLKRIEIR